MNLVRLKIDIDCLLRLAKCSECEVTTENEVVVVTYFDCNNNRQVFSLASEDHEDCLFAAAEAIRG